MSLEDEKYIQNNISKNNSQKEKIFKKLNFIEKESKQIININKTNISLSSNNLLERILKECIKYNEFLSVYSNKEINNDIIKLYKNITGISISKTNELNLKIRFDFLCDNNIEYYIILSYENNKYNIISITPDEINLDKKYLEELNITKDINLFLCKLINFELIPYYEKEKK